MSDININDEHDVRLHKLRILEDHGVLAYPARVGRTHTMSQASSALEGERVTVGGRVMAKRSFGKLTFTKLSDNSGAFQAAFQMDSLGEASFQLFTNTVDSGDIIEVTGIRFTTQKGEASIRVIDWKMLSKSLLPLPSEFYGLEDEETRYRKRYLDFLLNSKSKENIIIRSRLLRALRDFLYKKDFVEVETPMLETIASGALAKTFDTHLNAFDLPVHLRICIGELWQKRLLVGGFEKTFEIGRAFRNEGVDHQHNPEFTMIEYYWAYADYEDNMRLHEEMIPHIVEAAIGKLQVEVDGQVIDFSGPYQKVTFHDVVLEYSGIDIDLYTDRDSLAKEMKNGGYEVDNTASRATLMDDLYKQSARIKLIQPTFVLNYPIELKPLAKKANDPRYTEMFQLIVNGFELSNSYTELNDPIDQRERFAVQAGMRAEGDEEAMSGDMDYVIALEHGMPPATGTGIGIDRFVALITGSHALREIMAFPLMKPNNIEV